MDWTLALNRNRDALLRLMTVLWVSAGLKPGEAATTLPRSVRLAVLRLLRPAESAARRLIVVAAFVLEITARAAVARPAPVFAGQVGDGGARALSFSLFDRLQRFTDTVPRRHPAIAPRISVPGLYDPVFAATEDDNAPDDRADSAHRLGQRLAALQRVLDDLPAQARRYARWKARRERVRTGRLTPMRPGRPPGHRARPTHTVDTILGDCEILARLALKPPI